MCGPLVLMSPVVGDSRASIAASRILYHVGRLTTYALIGLIFGLVGESLVLAGLQRWLSIIVGVLMLLILILAIPLKAQLTRAPLAIKSLFGRFLRQRSYRSIFALGAVNGLLPCGLVYMAATASIVAGSAIHAALYMFLFGLGTVPMLLAVSFAAVRLNFAKFPAMRKLTPIAVASVAILLIVRADPVSLLRGESGAAKCPMCAAR